MHLPRSLLLLLAITALAAGTAAQSEPPSYSCERVYVDPVNGNDTNAGSLASPLRTANAGIQAIQTSSGTGTVVLLPGIYSLSTNGEVYPLTMVDGISLQGTNALNTVLDSSGQFPSEVVLFRQFQPSSTYQFTFVNGLTITNNQVGAAVRIRGDLAKMSPTISNCVLVQNCAGVVIQEVQPFVQPPPWVRHTPTIIHCTITENELGIYDGAFTTNGTLLLATGLADSAIVNSIVFGNSSDLVGVDDTDLVRVAFGNSQVGPAPCGLDALGFPVLVHPPPVTDVDLTGWTPATLFVDPASWDYRTFPETPQVDQGDPGPTWVAPNGTQAIVSFPCHPDATTVDAEGHGNPRLEGGAPDLGADELGQLIVAGYQPKTTTFGGAHLVRAIYMTPQPPILGAVKKATHFLTLTAPGYANQQPFGTPGVNPLGSHTCVPRAGLQCTGPDCLDPLSFVPGFPQVVVMPDVGAPLLTPLTPGASDEQYCLQIVPRNGSGSEQTCLSNLQCYVVAP
jgi:hypothetical protein